MSNAEFYDEFNGLYSSRTHDVCTLTKRSRTFASRKEEYYVEIKTDEWRKEWNSWLQLIRLV